MATAVLVPYPLELLDDPLDAIVQQAGKMQIAEGVEEIELLLSETRLNHWILLRII